MTRRQTAKPPPERASTPRQRWAEAAATPDDPGWRIASADEPCPYCGADAGCSFQDGGEFLRCMVTASMRPILGGGWLHRLSV